MSTFKRISPLLVLGIALFLAGCQTTQNCPPPVTQPTSQAWEKEIAAFEVSDKTNAPPRNGILFIGSSSIRLWTNLGQDFPGKPVFNRGFGGSQIIDSVHFADRIVFPYKPKTIVLYAGGNDLNAKKSADQVFTDFKLFAETVRCRLPKTRIVFISSAPNPARWAQIEEVRKANRLIRNYIEASSNMAYIDVHPAMLGPDGQPKPDIYRADKLHMNEKGYAIWKQVVGPYVR